MIDSMFVTKENQNHERNGLTHWLEIMLIFQDIK